MTRIKQNVEYERGFKYRSEDLRFATPKAVADYRAKRLSCDTLLEIGAGVGFQTIAFSRTCNKVIAVEIDKERFKFLKINLDKAKNTVLINGDALKEDLQADVIFVDTEREPSEKERTLDTIKPNIKKILEKFKNKNICIEVPPQTRNIELNCEKEYVSLHNKLNRLNLYFNDLKKCETSLVLLPEKVFLNDKNKEKLKLITDYENYSYIYEINPAVIRADLLGSISNKELFLYNGGNKFYFFSNTLIDSKFLKPYRILKDNSTLGKVILHGNVSPADYIRIKRSIESIMPGKVTGHVFLLKENLFAEEI
ncbi:hypothetical protein J4468_00215 [Candidatus Woesearchaeota archaeon]|nr:hypothetical protein [Candidatus Woesearchaeota archaeon]